MRPDCVVASRGGRNRTVAVPSAPGNSDRLGGLELGPCAGGPEHRERELVDDASGVPDRDLAGRYAARVDVESVRLEGGGGTHLC